MFTKKFYKNEFCKRIAVFEKKNMMKCFEQFYDVFIYFMIEYLIQIL